MAATALVAEPVRSSLALLQDLEDHGLPVEAAFWLLDPESRIWHLYVASPGVAEHGSRKAYERAQEAIDRTGVEIPLAQIKNALIYATGTASPYREPCRRLLSAVASGGLPATTTVEVRSDPRGAFDAVLAAAALGRPASTAEVCAQLVHPRRVGTCTRT